MIFAFDLLRRPRTGPTDKARMMPKNMLNEKNGNREAEIINAAYGLVQGVYGDGDMSSNAGHREWSKPKVQQAAMDAAEAFLAKVNG